jgi:hypothetical protein
LNTDSLDIESVRVARTSFVCVDAGLDRKGLRPFGDIAGVDELGPDPRFYAGADTLGIRLVAISRGELVHLERATTDENRSPGNGSIHHAFDS